MIIGVIAVLLMVLVSGAAGQEPVLTCDPTQDVEIEWNGTGTWIAATVISTAIVPGAPSGSHKRMGKLGQQSWTAVSPDSTEAVPTKIDMVIDVQALPAGSRFFAPMRLRVRCRMRLEGEEDKVGEWSEASDPVYVINLEALKPGKPRKN